LTYPDEFCLYEIDSSTAGIADIYFGDILTVGRALTSGFAIPWQMMPSLDYPVKKSYN